MVGWGEEKSRQKVYNCHRLIVYMSVTMEKPAEQDVVAEKVKYIVDCYIKRKKVVMTTTSAPVAEVDGETNQPSNSIFLLVKVGKCQRRLNLWSNASRLPRHLLLKLMGMIQCTDQASHFSLNYQASNMSLTNFVDQISAFPSLSDFNVVWNREGKWAGGKVQGLTRNKATNGVNL